MTAPTCAVCGGPVHRSTIGSGFDRPVWVHDRREDWIDRPHNVRLAETTAAAS